jgi:hypothetical protein
MCEKSPNMRKIAQYAKIRQIWSPTQPTDLQEVKSQNRFTRAEIASL